MIRAALRLFLAFCLLAALPAVPAWAEVVLPLNDPAGPVAWNDQPATATAGATTHAAWIGGPSSSGPFALYYASFKGAADLTNLALSRTSLLQVPPTLVADGGAGVRDVRRPWVGALGSDCVAILFQGRDSSSADDAWGIYLATFRVAAGAVVSPVSVRRLLGGPGAGDATFPSAVLDGADGTVRFACSFLPAGSAAVDRRRVLYARAGIDNGLLFPGTPIELSARGGDPAFPASRGFLPLPSLGVDPSRRAHVAWVSEGDEPLPWRTSGVWYAMVAVVNGTDTVQIGGTNVIGRNRAWSRPHALPYEDTRVFVTAWDNAFAPLAGSVGVAHLNPNEAPRDGSPVNLGDNRKFLLQPPGEAILPPDFDLFQPTATADKGGRIFLAGYGSPSSPLTYLVANPLTAPPSLVTPPTAAALGPAGFASSIPGEPTYPALAFHSDRAFLLWSGFDNVDASRRNVNVTSVFTTKQWQVVDESGCSAAGGALDGLLAALLVLPAARLLSRRSRTARREE